MSAVLQRRFDGTGPGAFEELAVEGSRGKEGRILADYVECLEKTSIYKECGGISLLK